MVFKHNRYEIVRKLGEGGMGSVFLAKDKLFFNKLVALKIINKTFLSNLNNLVHEYEIMSKLWHDNIAKIYEFDRTRDGVFFLAMEYVEGRELNEVINDKIDYNSKIEIIAHLLRAVDFIHSRNIIYNDIKPQNIMVTKNNKIKIIDFGLSDFSTSNDKNIKGTIKYISPEVINHQKKDIRSDIFSLGVLFYELITEKSYLSEENASNASNASNILTSYSHVDIYNKKLKQAFAFDKNSKVLQIIKKMCSFSKKDRYSSCAEILAKLKEDQNIKNIETEETKNAFVTGVPFTDRHKELLYLIAFYTKEDSLLLTLNGEKGVGKSELLKHFKRYCNLNDLPVIVADCTHNAYYGPWPEILKQVLFTYSKVTKRGQECLAHLLPDHELFKESSKAELEPALLKKVIIEELSIFFLKYVKNQKKNPILIISNFYEADNISYEIIEELAKKILEANSVKCKIIIETRNTQWLEQSDFFKENELLKTFDNLKLKNFTKTEIELFFKSVFGKDFIHNSVLEQLSSFYSYSNGNPLMLQEILKVMIAENCFVRENKYWVLKKDITKIQIGTDIKSVFQKRFSNLEFNTNETNFLISLCLSKNLNYCLKAYGIKLADSFSLNFEQIIDKLLQEEIIDLSDGFFEDINKILADTITESISSSELDKLHKNFIRVIENQNTTLFSDLENVELLKLTELLNHYFALESINYPQFKEKVYPLALECVKRDKERFFNSKAVSYLKNTLNILEKFDKNIIDYKLKAEIFFQLAELERVLNHWSEAEKYYHESFELSLENQDNELQLKLKNSLASLYRLTGDIKKAKLLLHENLQLYPTADDKSEFANTFNTLGSIYAVNGKNIKALDYYKKSLKIYKKNNDKNGLGIIYNNIGNTYSHMGQNSKALEYLKKTISNREYKKNKLNKAIASNNIAVIYYRNGDFSNAMKYYQKCLNLCKEIHEKRGISIAEANIGSIYDDLGDHKKAMSYFKKALVIKEKIGDKKGMVILLSNIGISLTKIKHYKKGMNFFDKAIETGKMIEANYFLCSAILGKANLLSKIGESETAINLCKYALEVARKANRKEIVTDANITIYYLNKDSDSLMKLLKTEELSNYQKGSIFLKLWHLTSNSQYRFKALDIFEKLYAGSPIQDYLENIKILKQ